MANGKIKGGELHIGVKLAIWIIGIVSLASVAYATIYSNKTEIQSVRKDHEALKDAFLEFRGEWKVVASDINIIKERILKK